MEKRTNEDRANERIDTACDIIDNLDQPFKTVEARVFFILAQAAIYALLEIANRIPSDYGE